MPLNLEKAANFYEPNLEFTFKWYVHSFHINQKIYSGLHLTSMYVTPEISK